MFFIDYASDPGLFYFLVGHWHFSMVYQVNAVFENILKLCQCKLISVKKSNRSQNFVMVKTFVMEKVDKVSLIWAGDDCSQLFVWLPFLICFGKGGAVKFAAWVNLGFALMDLFIDCAHQYLKLFRMIRGKVVLLFQDGLKAILPVLIDRYGILHVKFTCKQVWKATLGSLESKSCIERHELGKKR